MTSIRLYSVCLILGSFFVQSLARAADASQFVCESAPNFYGVVYTAEGFLKKSGVFSAKGKVKISRTGSFSAFSQMILETNIVAGLGKGGTIRITDEETDGQQVLVSAPRSEMGKPTFDASFESQTLKLKMPVHCKNKAGKELSRALRSS